MNKETTENEIKEPFCGACVAGIAAVAGAGTAKSSDNLSKDKETRKRIFWISVFISVISILYVLYQLCFGNCSECK